MTMITAVPHVASTRSEGRQGLQEASDLGRPARKAARVAGADRAVATGVAGAHDPPWR